MSRFTDALVVTPMENGKTWVILSDFGYESEKIWSVMESKGKAREFRNQIAHTGRKFTRQTQYKKLSAQVESITKVLLAFRV